MPAADRHALAAQHLEAIRTAAEQADAGVEKAEADARKIVLEALLTADAGPASRTDMAEALGLSRQTFYDRYGQDLDEARDERRRR